MKNIATIFLAALCSLVVMVTAASAQTIYGSGYGADLSSSAALDAHWDIVAVPAGFTPPSNLPYAAYVPQYIPAVWAGAAWAPSYWATQNGVQGDYWIAPQLSPNVPNSLLPASDAGYNWIAAQTFYVAQAGTYDFDFPGAGDNQMSFYIDGSLSYADPIHPTITGGTQIGSMIDDLSQLSDFTGETTLTAGDHTAYVVLTDFGGQTGALIGQSTFEPASVPEPSTYALVGLALSGLALVRRRQNKGN